MAVSDESQPPSADLPAGVAGVPPNRWRILVAVLYGLFAVNVTITILAVSIHRIAGEFGTAESTMTWVVTGPMLAFGVVGPLVGKLGDRIGMRRIYLWGLGGATVMAFASALAWSAGALIAFRTLGAIEGAATGPASFAVISRIFPQEERVRALGFWAMVAAGAPVVGVVIGGPMVEAFGWRALFWGQIPLIVAAFVFAFRLFPETPKHLSGRFDIAGAALIALGVTPLLFAINEGPRIGWTSPVVLGAFLLGPIALYGFVRAERVAEQPLLPLRYLRVPGFTYAIVTMAVLNAAYMGSFILTPLLLQNVMGFSETKTGLVSIARPLAFAIAGPLAARVVVRLGARPTASGGAVAVVCALILMATLGASSTVLAVMAALALAGVGMGMASPPLSASVTVSVDEADYGIAGAAQQMMIQVGVVFGITVMQSVQQSRLPAVGLQASYHWGYAAGVVLAAAAVFTATRIASTHRSEPALRPESEPLPAL